jgi:prevent-host-death family protein
MESVGSRELKNRLGKYLRLVRQGETIVITDRGEPVAELRPLEPARSDLTKKLQRLVARGSISLPKRDIRSVRPPLRLPGVSLSDAIAEDREDRF